MSGHGNTNSSILPNIPSQAKWKYAKGEDFFRVTDGHHVYNFGMAGKFSDEDKLVDKLEDVPTPEFNKGAVEEGTAQVHRASPDNIYLTLADGKLNPTFELKHHDGKQWKYAPSKKFIDKLKKQTAGSVPTILDPDSLIRGATGMLKKSVFDLSSATELLAHGVPNALGSLLDFRLAHPALAATGAVVGANTLLPKLFGKKPNMGTGLLAPLAASTAVGAVAPAIKSML